MPFMEFRPGIHLRLIFGRGSILAVPPGTAAIQVGANI